MKSSIDFISLRSVTVNKLCRENCTLLPKLKLAKRSVTYWSVPTPMLLQGKDARRAHGAPTHRGKGWRQRCLAISPPAPACLRQAEALRGGTRSAGLPAQRFCSPRASFCSWHLFLLSVLAGGCGPLPPPFGRGARSRQKPMIDVKAGSEQLLIWLWLFHLLTFRSVLGIFIHRVALNGIWCSTSPGTMKERC